MLPGPLRCAVLFDTNKLNERIRSFTEHSAIAGERWEREREREALRHTHTQTLIHIHDGME